MSNQVHEDGSLKLPGEIDPDYGRLVREYLAHFAYYKIRKEHAQKEALYQWCADYMGEKYKDWFIHEGGNHDRWWSVNIRNPRHCTLFSLRWADIIIEFVDRRQQ